MRYAVTKIPWDFSSISSGMSEAAKSPDEDLTPEQREVKERREAFMKAEQDEHDRIEEEFDEWNDSYG
jgi:hypothetical protein